MKACLLFVLIIFTSNTFSQNVSPQFSELKGMEDQSGNTHLLYRIYSHYSNDPFYYSNNDIYHFDLEINTDSLFLADFSYSNPDPFQSSFRIINDYDFWLNDFTKYIYGGVQGTFEPLPFIRRFDEANIYLNYIFGEIKQIDISQLDDSLLYAGGWLSDVNTARAIRSVDGGFNWIPVSDSLEFLSLNPSSD